MKKTIVVLIVVLAAAFFAIMVSPLSLSLSSVKILTVSGNSMEPVISEKDVVVVLPADYKDLKIGDIIVYKHEIEGNEFSFTHRIVAIEYENGDGEEVRILTKGDNLPAPDDYFVRSSQIVGTVVLIIPFIGAFLRFANSFYGLLLLIIIPATLIIYMEVRKIIRYKRAKHDNDL